MNVRILSAAVWLLGALLAPMPVWAGQVQEPPPEAPNQPLPPQVRRPYRGLFGAPGTGKHSLTLAGSIYGAYDDDVFADQFEGGAGVIGVRADGKYGGMVADLDYERTGRVALTLGTGVGLTKYGDRDVLPTYRATGSISATRRRTTLSANAGVVYSPHFRLGLFVSPLTVSGFADPFESLLGDYDVYGFSAYRSSLGASASQSLGRRATLSAFYGLFTVDSVKGPYNYQRQHGGALFTRDLTRHLGLRAGYGYSVAHYTGVASDQRPGLHNIDVGVTYSRALSVSRRTKFGFSTGSVLFASDSAPANRSGRELQYRLTGSADLTHEMGRTWTTALTYRRGVEFQEGFYAPFLSDAVSATLGGLFSRRIKFDAATNYTRGIVGFAARDAYSTGSATAQLQFAITRILGAYATYFIYHYDFSNSIAIDPRFPRALDRQGVRVGLVTSLPLIR